MRYTQRISAALVARQREPSRLSSFVKRYLTPSPGAYKHHRGPCLTGVNGLWFLSVMNRAGLISNCIAREPEISELDLGKYMYWQ